jgi:hypothetical protein
MPDVKAVDPDIAAKIFMQRPEGDLSLARLDKELEVPMGVFLKAGLIAESRSPENSAFADSDKGSRLNMKNEESILSKRGGGSELGSM